ncbi:uncharacterized protein LOC110862457 [Folsomia candida]|uniref:Protein kintoun n=1 Tax=Folsomia candida TaxID=158441 RepID=A0A226CY17_FOLCA|nr:uncharacterized protein LOC110862457 [Folsomia candida]OXA37428.1 Protein kintoun [Folsomia candida]
MKNIHRQSHCLHSSIFFTRRKKAGTMANIVTVLFFAVVTILQMQTTIADPIKLHPKNETGPLSPEMFLLHPRLAWLGKTNGRNYYIERTFSKWADANKGCQEMGMELAQFRFQSELDFVQAATTPDDNGAWCGGLSVTSRTIFQYGSGEMLPAFDVGFQTQLGLVVQRGNPSACLSTRPASLHSTLNNYVGYYFCHI